MRITLILLSLLLVSMSLAQEVRQVSCRFLCFGSAANPEPVIALGDEEDETICPLPLNKLSEPVNCFATKSKIKFLSSADRKTAAIATIPASAKSVILVFVPGPKAKPGAATLPWRVLAIEDSAKNFPDGGVFVANFHNGDIRFAIGEHKGMLHAAGSHGYKMPEKRDDFNMAQIMFELSDRGKWRVATETRLRILTGTRYLIFAYMDPASGRPRIKTCQDLKSVAAQ